MRAAMVADPCESTWSSHRCHGAGHADPILDSFPEWEQLGRTEPERRARWRRKVRGEQPAKELDGVRSSVRSGRPYGAEDWDEVISHCLGIVREPRCRGRPPREKMLSHRNSGRLVLRLAKRCSDTGILHPDTGILHRKKLGHTDLPATREAGCSSWICELPRHLHFQSSPKIGSISLPGEQHEDVRERDRCETDWCSPRVD